MLQAPATKEGDYDVVRKVISDILEKDEHYDDGRAQPLSCLTCWGTISNLLLDMLPDSLSQLY